MGCCEATNPGLLGRRQDFGRAAGWPDVGVPWDRRTALKSLLGTAGVIAVSGCAGGQEASRSPIRLAFCGQLLCVIPYEVTRVQGHFEAQGLSAELVYTRGGSAAMQALVGGSVDYAGTSFDVALQAAANGAEIRRVASTGRLPLFALAVAPERTASITRVADLEGTTVGISGLGNADHALLLFLLDQAGADASSVSVAAVGTNLFDALRLGQVDAGMLQEPALSLIVDAGGRELVNFMDLTEAERHVGGAYEFMGVSVRTAERDERLEEIRRLAVALEGGLRDTRTLPPADIVAALPSALVAGGDLVQLEQIIARYRASLYPETVMIDTDAAARVRRAQEIAGLLESEEVDLRALLDTEALVG